MAFPQIDACLVCEGTRLEVGGKYTILGFYGIAPNVRVALMNFDQPVTLCFFFVGGAGSGPFKIALRILAESGATVPIQCSEVDGNLLAEKKATFLIMQFQSKMPGAGQYQVQLVGNGEVKYTTQFALVQGIASELRGLL